MNFHSLIREEIIFPNEANSWASDELAINSKKLVLEISELMKNKALILMK